jgi:Uma2 family endonuclease
MQYYKTDSGSWLLTDYQTADAVLELASIDLQIPLSEIYEQVDFELPDQ